MLNPFSAKDRELAHTERARQREMTHAERMKAMELGLPFPEVELARARAEEVKARAEAAKTIILGIVRLLSSLGAFGIAVGATAIVLAQCPPALHLPALAIIWVSSSLVALTATAAGWLDLRRLDWRNRVGPRPEPSEPLTDRKFRNAIQE